MASSHGARRLLLSKRTRNHSKELNAMTYQQLKEELAKLTPEQLQMDVALFDYNMDEYFFAREMKISGSDDYVLGLNHPFIIFTP